MSQSPLAIQGGPKAVTKDPGDIFRWPIVTEEDEQAVLEVLRAGGMSGNEVTLQFAREFADWNGRAYGLGYPNGTQWGFVFSHKRFSQTAFVRYFYEDGRLRNKANSEGTDLVHLYECRLTSERAILDTIEQIQQEMEEFHELLTNHK